MLRGDVSQLRAKTCASICAALEHKVFNYSGGKEKEIRLSLAHIQGGPKKSKPHTHDHNFVKP